MIDTHCHLADEAYAADLEAVVARGHAAGVTDAMCILSSSEPVEVERAAVVSKAWPGVHFAAGVHPHQAGVYEGRAAAAADDTRRALAASAAIVIGEIGLDYHYDFSP